jgi:predicted bacteriocin transport accessory protein
MTDRLVKAFLALMFIFPSAGCRRQEPLVVPDELINDIQVSAKPISEPLPDDTALTYANMVPYGIGVDQKVFIQSRMSRIMNRIDKRESFAICIGKDDCPWCARAVPVLYQTAEEMDVTVEYVDLSDDYSWRTEDQSESFDRFVELVGDSMRADENGNPQLYVPFVVYIRNGTVADAHVSTLDDDDAESELTDEQRGKLKQIYYSGFIRAGL